MIKSWPIRTLYGWCCLPSVSYTHLDTVLAAVRSVPGICRVELESAADGQVTFTAESEDAADRRAAVSRARTEAGCTVLALAAENRSLEEVFLCLLYTSRCV